MNQVEKLRKKHNLSQKKLGEILRVSQQTISRYEKSEINIPNDVLLRMANFFNTPIEYILQDETKSIENHFTIPGVYHHKEDIIDIFKNLTPENQNLLFEIGAQLLNKQNKPQS